MFYAGFLRLIYVFFACCLAAHSSVVTTAVFAPIPGLFANAGLTEVGEVIVAADYQGEIKIYVSGAEL